MNNSNINWQSSSATGSPDNPTFIDLTKPQVVDVEQLEQCAEPDEIGTLDDADRDRFYLVARVDGVISRGPAPTQQDDGACVVYINEDGLAFERQFHVVSGDWSEIPASCVAPVDSIAQPATDTMLRMLSAAMEAHREADVGSCESDILVADNGAEIMTDGGEDVDDWDAIRSALIKRGLGVGAIHHLETFEPAEVGL